MCMRMQVVIKDTAQQGPDAEALRQAAAALKLPPVGAASSQSSLPRQASGRKPFAFQSCRRALVGMPQAAVTAVNTAGCHRVHE